MSDIAIAFGILPAIACVAIVLALLISMFTDWLSDRVWDKRFQKRRDQTSTRLDEHSACCQAGCGCTDYYDTATERAIRDVEEKLETWKPTR